MELKLWYHRPWISFSFKFYPDAFLAKRESTFAAFMDGLDGYFGALLRLSMEEELLPVTDTNIFVRCVCLLF